jgi:hypothetical protein
MPKESPIKELEDQADEALELCWARLAEQKEDFTDIELMIKAWRTKQEIWQEREDNK